jgi:Alpha/beta hydrolase
VSGHYPYLGDDPGAVAAKAEQLGLQGWRAESTARAVELVVTRIGVAWPEGQSGKLAAADAAKAADAYVEVAHAYRSARNCLKGYLELLPRWRRRVDLLNEARESLALAQARVDSLERNSFGDPLSEERAEDARRGLSAVRGHVGFHDVSEIDVAYTKLMAIAEDETRDIDRDLRKLAAAGTRTPTGGVGSSKFRAEFALLAVGLAGQGRLAPTVAALVASGVLPPAAQGFDARALSEWLVGHPGVAAGLVANLPGNSVPGSPEAFLASVGRPPGPGIGSADPGKDQRDSVRGFFETMTPAEQAMLAVLFPAVVGNLAGAPFAARAAANRVRIVATLDEQKRLIDDLATERGQLHFKSVGARDRIDGELDEARDRLDVLQRIVDDPSRQIVYFDNAGDGGLAELHGTINAKTGNVGVFVPGTGSSLAGFETNARRSVAWVKAAGGTDHPLAMVTWMGGDFPNDVLTDAGFRDYADRLGPDLANFSHETRQEVDQAGAPARVTVMGHSYGGAAVGTSERYGLDADRVVHLESPGMGHDVRSPEDLHPARAEVRRYSITAPEDSINAARVPTWIQDLPGLDGMGHGENPDTFPGTTRLASGRYADGSPIDGPFAAHSGVLTVDSDAWLNTFAVLTGGQAHTPMPDQTRPGPHGETIRVPDYDLGPKVDIP